MPSLKNVVPAATTKRQEPRIPRSVAAPRKLTFGLPDLNHPLSLLLAAASIPVLLFADWIAYNAADNQRAAAIVLAHDTVDRVGGWITAEMTNQVQVAEALALSPSLDNSDFGSFYREAQTLKATRPLWFTVELDDLQGMQVLNLLRPFGNQLGPTADRESFEEVLRDRRPVIGSIGPVGAVSGRRLLALRIPVIRNHALRYVLTIGMAPDAVSDILRKAGLPYGWIGAVVDRHGNLIARSLSENENWGAQQNRPCMMRSLNPQADSTKVGPSRASASTRSFRPCRTSACGPFILGSRVTPSMGLCDRPFMPLRPAWWAV